jgi:ubiquinone/menaquinone biosynthesis C-methylase UbiE
VSRSNEEMLDSDRTRTSLSTNQETPAYLSFDTVAEEYDQSRYLPPEVQREAAEKIRDMAALKPGQILLDAGVGTGRFAMPLSDLEMRVVGVDISSKMLSRLQAKHALRDVKKPSLGLVQGDLRHLPLLDDTVEAVLVVHILHLIANWQQVLREVKRVLAPGGKFVLAQEGGERLRTRSFYFDRAKERQVLRAPLGATAAQILDFLKLDGAQVARVDDDQIQWQIQMPVVDTLEMLRRRTWSHMWAIPDAEHQALMSATESWAKQTYGTREATETAPAKLFLWIARWDA